MGQGRRGKPRPKACTLGDLLDIKHGFAFQGEHFSDAGTHIVLTPGNFFEEGGFKSKVDKEKWYTGPIPPDYVLSQGDLIVAMTEQGEGLLGSAAIIPRSGLYLHNQRLGLVQIRDAQRTDRRFVYYLFNSKVVRQQIRASASGSKIRHTAPSRIGEVTVRVPPLPVQQRISAILSAYDDLIENNTRRIRILEEIAQALHREWFVHFRFPGHEKVRKVESALGQIPEGWGVVKLADLAEVNASSVRRGNEPDRISYIDIASLSTGSVNEAQRYKFAEAPGRARRIVRHGDILWSMVRPNRKSYALLLNPDPDVIVSTGFAVLSPTHAPFAYLYHAVTTDDFATYLTNHATGAAYPAVNAQDFEQAQVLRPSRILLDRYQEIAEPWLEFGDHLRRKNANLRTTRDLLLPKLISGELDVSRLDVSVAGGRE
ncbi:MAG: restriction endonuclease subunit S [Deltaproteobacteria bacterium]|nr:restriction endonuclease subunit S [Deltaproteobacteria bacterium]